MKDWYFYLDKEFRLDKSVYRTRDRVVVLCPRCKTTSVVRINHLKAKIKKLGYYECSMCRRLDNLKKAREAFKDKYGNINPFQLKNYK